MRMKRVLLATTALASMAGAPQAQADGFYVSVFGGANFVQDSSGGFEFATETAFLSEHDFLDADTGFALGAAVGVRLDNWLNGLRTEFEVSYRRSDLGGTWDLAFDFPFLESPIATSGTIDGNLSTFAIIANVAYDIDVDWKVKPYVIAGAGWARSKLDGVLIPINDSELPPIGVDSEGNGFAWQLGVGLNYEVAPGVDVGLGYRYFKGPSTSIFSGKFPTNDSDNRNNSVMATLTIETN